MKFSHFNCKCSLYKRGKVVFKHRTSFKCPAAVRHFMVGNYCCPTILQYFEPNLICTCNVEKQSFHLQPFLKNENPSTQRKRNASNKH